MRLLAGAPADLGADGDAEEQNREWSFVHAGRWLEQLLGMRFLNTDVYPVSFLPVDLLARDVLLVGAIAFVMCVLAAIYPARRAAALAPALILNQDH